MENVEAKMENLDVADKKTKGGKKGKANDECPVVLEVGHNSFCLHVSFHKRFESSS